MTTTPVSAMTAKFWMTAIDPPRAEVSTVGEGVIFDTGRTLATGDARIFVSEAGNPSGPPIVLLHGGLGSRMDFEPLARLLAPAHRLIALDSRGHGRSTLGRVPLSYRQLADDMTAALQQLGLTEAGIIGHSDGGIVGLRLAAAAILRPRFLIAVGAHWHLPENDPSRGIFGALTLARWREKFPESIRRYEAENPEPDFPRLFAATLAMWMDDGPDSYPGTTVRTISCPLLVIRGDDDFLVSPAQASGLVEQVKGARLLNLPFAGHGLLEDAPEDALPAITRFIAAAQASG